MNFKEWSKKYYPDEDRDVLDKMSHAWAAGHGNMACSETIINFEEPLNRKDCINKRCLQPESEWMCDRCAGYMPPAVHANIKGKPCGLK